MNPPVPSPVGPFQKLAKSRQIKTISIRVLIGVLVGACLSGLGLAGKEAFRWFRSYDVAWGAAYNLETQSTCINGYADVVFTVKEDRVFIEAKKPIVWWQKGNSVTLNLHELVQGTLYQCTASSGSVYKVTIRNIDPIKRTISFESEKDL